MKAILINLDRSRDRLAQRRGDVIIIDDARIFGLAPAYPRLDDFVALLRARHRGGDILVADDSIFVLPPASTSG